MPHDAVRIPAPPPSVPRVSPRSTPIWLRVNGSWYAGDVQRWFRLDGGGWGFWGCFQSDPEHPTVSPRWGNWAYDPAAVVDRQRHPERPEG